MKRTFKKIVSLLAVAVMSVCCFSFAACEDIKTLEIQIQAYNYTDKATYEDVTLTVDLYRHLAPKTVDAIVEYVEEGYYDNTTFYLLKEYSNQIMVGDLKLDGKTIKQNATKPTVAGEFEKGGTTGSDLVNNEGYVGLWRSWASQGAEKSSYKQNNGMTSGSATWYIPTAEIADYNGYFCVFGKFDLENEDNKTAIDYIKSALNNNSEQYVIYYTGEYNAEAENNGLTFNCISLDDFNALSEDDKDKIFVAEGNQLVSYNQKTISVPKFEGDSAGAMIKSITVK